MDPLGYRMTAEVDRSSEVRDAYPEGCEGFPYRARSLPRNPQEAYIYLNRETACGLHNLHCNYYLSQVAKKEELT
jgi:hypothetical protein